MDLYKKDGSKLNPLRQQSFKLERPLQKLVQENLGQLFGLEFIATEFSIDEFRFDTVAFDNELNSFVVIEYKRDRKSSIVDQGTAYLTHLLHNKAELTLIYNEACGVSKSKKDFDWEQVRVMFVAARFDKYQIDAAAFPNLPIELYQVQQFQGNLFSINRVDQPEKRLADKGTGKLKTSNRGQLKSSAEITAVEDLHPVSEESLFAGIPEPITELYQEFKDAILSWDDNVEVKATKFYMSFKINRHSFFDFRPQQQKAKLWINAGFGELDDPRKLARNVKSIGHWGNGDYEFDINDDQNIEYILSLVKVVFEQKKAL